MAPALNIVFQTPSIRVEDATFAGQTDSVVVTFPYAGRRDTFREGFGRGLFAEQGISAVHVTTGWSHWFQVGDMDDALTVVRAITQRFKRVVTYGQSMGGYGAVVCSRGVGANAILALAPQSSLDPGKAPWENRWPDKHQEILKREGYCRDNISELIAKDAVLHVIFDPRSIDALHAKVLLSCSSRPHPFPVPFSGHRVAEFLAEMNVLKPIALAVINGDDRWKDWRNAMRARRRTSMSWWLNLAHAARKRPALAAKAAQQALNFDPENAKAQVTYAKALVAAKRTIEAVEGLSRFVAHNPHDGVARLGLAQILTRSRRGSDALGHFQAAAELLPQNYHARLGIAGIAAEAGDMSAAREAIDDARKLGAPDALLDRVRKRAHLQV